MTNKYKSVFELSKYPKYILDLPFLHTKEVEDCFTEELMN